MDFKKNYQLQILQTSRMNDTSVYISFINLSSIPLDCLTNSIKYPKIQSKLWTILITDAFQIETIKCLRSIRESQRRLSVPFTILNTWEDHSECTCYTFYIIMAALSLIPIRPSVHYYATARIVEASRPPYLCSETTRIKNKMK